MAVVAAVHTAVVVASWLFATVLYAVVVAKSRQLAWIAIDGAVIALCGWWIYIRRDALGFRSLGPRRGAKLLAIIAFATLCALIVQLVVRDLNGVWLDESNYLATVRAGHIIRDGRLPYNLRWLVPLLAGSWNVLPVDDADAVKAINFGAFAVTGAFLILLLVRLRIRLGLALAAPVFLLCSYLGVYGARNRLVLDAFNYALYVILFHLAMRREHRGLFGATLLVSAFNAEKAIYWVPVVFLVEALRGEPPSPDRSRRQWWTLYRHPAVLHTVWCCGPTVLYILAIRLYLAPSVTEWNLCFENIDVMSLSALRAEITNPMVKGNTFQALWLPFGAFTMYALLGFSLAERWMKPIVLLLIPIFIQNVIACDGERMMAYSFIVYLPFGYLYLARAFTDMPRALARTLFGLSVALAVLEHYLFLVGPHLRVAAITHFITGNIGLLKMILSATELALVGTIVFVHLTFFPGRAGPRVEGDAGGRKLLR